MTLKSVCVMTAAMVLASFASALSNQNQWLSRKGASPNDRVLGRVDGGNFITCNRRTVKMAEITDVTLMPANGLRCPSAGFAASVDGGDDGAQEAREKKEDEILKRLKEKPAAQ